MSDPGEDPNFEAAAFGREVELWIEEDSIGRYVIERARQQVQEAQAELLTVDPTDTKTITALQTKAGIALSVAGWLREAIEQGHAAAATLQHEHDVGGDS